MLMCANITDRDITFHNAACLHNDMINYLNPVLIRSEATACRAVNNRLHLNHCQSLCDHLVVLVPHLNHVLVFRCDASLLVCCSSDRGNSKHSKSFKS